MSNAMNGYGRYDGGSTRRNVIDKKIKIIEVKFRILTQFKTKNYFEC